MRKNAKENRRRADRLLAPMIRYVEKHHGAKSLVQKLMSAKLGYEVTRTAVYNWLDARPEKRKMPDYETGLALMEVWKQMQDQRSEFEKKSVPC